MATYVMDKAYEVEASGGVGAGVAVKNGSFAGGCDLPSGANDGPVLGVTVHSAAQGRSVSVRKLGIASIVAASAVSAGEKVCVADALGRIKAAGRASAVSGVVGSNNAIRWTAKETGSNGNGIGVDIVVAGTDTSLSVSVSGNTVTINSATDGSGAAITTATQAIAAVAANAAASKLVSGADESTSNGSGAVADETVTLSGGESGDRAFGIAEETAVSQGDIIDVFLTL